MFNRTGNVNLSIRGFLSHGGTRIAGWLLFHGKSENNMDDLGVPLFQDTSKWGFS